MALAVYSCGLGSNHVTPIDTGTNLPGSNIHISSALAVAVTPDGTKAYVAQNGTLVTTIITATQTIGTTISGITGNCIGIAVTPDGTTAVVVTDAPELVLIDVASDTITNQIPITAGGTPSGMALTSDGLNCYTVSAAGPSVDIVQTTIPGGISTLIAGQSGTPSAFAGIALSPDDTIAYIVTDVGNPGTVSQYAIPSGTPGATVTVGDSPTGIAITPDGTELWVMNYGDGTISVVAIPALTVSSTITTVYATGSWDACFLPDGSMAYMTNKDNSAVLPVTVATVTPGAAITVSGDPWGIGTTPPAAAPDTVPYTIWADPEIYKENLFYNGPVTVVSLATAGTFATGPLRLLTASLEPGAASIEIGGMAILENSSGSTETASMIFPSDFIVPAGVAVTLTGSTPGQISYTYP